VVDPDDFWYSGPATGMLGGMYAPEESDHEQELPRWCEDDESNHAPAEVVGHWLSPVRKQDEQVGDADGAVAV
jgi:hypothetical protein